MNRSGMNVQRRAGLLAALAVTGLCHVTIAQAPPAATSPDAPHAMDRALVIDRTGRAGRSPIHTDAIEAQIVTGSWQPPTAGDIVTAADGSAHTWTMVNADQNGSISHESLQGGYACWIVESDQPRIMLLRASGHNCVYINGVIRTGDPYSNGIVQLPVQLQRGDNTLLFQCSRGRLAASLEAAPKHPFINLADVTLPDVLVNRLERPAGAVVIVNPTEESVDWLSIVSNLDGMGSTRDNVGWIPPLGVRKIRFTIRSPAPSKTGPTLLSLILEDPRNDPPAPLDVTSTSINCVEPQQLQRRTYISSVDGSVQYWALLPANPKEGDPGPWTLILTLHGADVEASGQAAAYAAKSWAHIVAPTNRRKFGFDWEDWGRIDAMDVLDLAQHELGLDGQRVFLTGHSMGGHGTWQIGATFPDRFLAIGPSAGWISFWSYAGASRFAEDKPIERMFRRASNPSDTLSLSRNYLHQGVYILHGDQDDNVPVEQARQMRKHLGEFHPDFAYYEQPGASHWWGNPCVDWPPMMQFFQDHRQTKNEDAVEFITANPGISCESKWARIESQIRPLQFSRVNLKLDRAKSSITGTTDNVKRLALLMGEKNLTAPLKIELDGQRLEVISVDPVKSTPNAAPLLFERDGEQWKPIDHSPAGKRSAVRNGPFKDVFRRQMLFVYGTHGSDDENAWALNKARFDAETFWYRGNGSIQVIADAAFDPAKNDHRNIILFGNSDTNSAWAALLANSPVQLKRGSVAIGGRSMQGEDLAALFIRPRADDDQCCVGVIGGSGLQGMRLTDRLTYFVSGAAYPDLTVFDGSVLTRGTEGVRAAGFFGDDWSVESGEFDWSTE